MLTTLPPKTPTLTPKKTGGRDKRKFYTIHSHPNRAFSFKMSEDHKTSIVGFKTYDHAVFIGSMIETHFVQKKEWPDTQIIGNLILPNTFSKDLKHVQIKKWIFEDLKLTCTRNILDLITVEDIVDSPSGFSFMGSNYMFEADTEFYQERFEELYELGDGGGGV
jgi:hypothetical protein